MQHIRFFFSLVFDIDATSGSLEASSVANEVSVIFVTD